MNKISKTMTIVLFFGLLLAVPIITLFSHKLSFSEIENRPLADFPKFSVDSVKSRKYMNNIENYLSDHFISRPDWIGLKTKAEIMSGKKEINGVYILNSRYVEKLEQPDSETVRKNISAINQFSERVNKPVFVMIAPTSAGIYAEEIPKNAPQIDQKAFIDSVYKQLDNDKIVTLDAFSALFPTRDEYIYYRNDHHWTTLGAYYAYASTIKKMGYSPVLYNKYDIEHASNSFRGTLYSKVLYDGIKPDVLDYYHYKDGTKVTSVVVDNGMEKRTYNSMYFKEFLDKKDKYSSFLGQNQPLVTIKTDSSNNSRLLVIKDSYAHCYVPFLTQHYSSITMADLRYLDKSIDQAVDLNDYDQVLILYNATTFSSDGFIKNLKFVK